MIIDNIELYNFCVYKGKHNINLTPDNDKKPVILIGALNGAGKTTLLDAIQLCLFGPFAQCSKKGKRSYKKYLKNCINKNAEIKHSNISLAFRHRIDGKEENFLIKRSWQENETKEIVETLEVTINGHKDNLLSDNWNSEVSKLFPASIAELFLFDGEKVESYADQKASSNMIKTAIEGLLGLDIIEQLTKDLKTFEKKVRLSETDQTAQNNIDTIECEIIKLQKKIEELRQQNAHTFTHKIERGNKKLEELKTLYEKKGGRLYDQKGEIEIVYGNTKVEYQNCVYRLLQKAETALPLSLIEGSILPQILDTSKNEIRADYANNVYQDIKDYNAKLLGILEKDKVAEKTEQKIKDLLLSKEAELELDSNYDIRLGISAEGNAILQSLLSNELSELKAETANEIANYEEIKAELDKLKTELASVPEKDELSEIIQKIEEQKKSIHMAQGETDRTDKEIKTLNFHLDRKQSELRRILEAEAKNQIKNLDQERLIKYSRLANEVTNKYKQKIIEKHINSIQANVLECYQTLLRKEGLINEILIDPITFEIQLYQTNRKPLHSDDLSAGERQILAISMLWGLAKTSGRALPTAIDTPMGRLDTVHRSKLINRYFPNASHQVILLSTDEEITGKYLSDLEPYISRKYILEYDNTSQSTRIIDGYFYGGELANVA